MPDPDPGSPEQRLQETIKQLTIVRDSRPEGTEGHKVCDQAIDRAETALLLVGGPDALGDIQTPGRAEP